MTIMSPNPSAGAHAGASLTRRDRRVAAGLFAVLALIYLLTFSGELRTIDELAMYAATESLVQIGRPVAPQVNFAAQHNPVGLIEPGQAIAGAPFYLLGRQFAHVNTIQAVLLLNVVVTALTGAALYLLARALGYGAAVSCLVALGYGLATTAWPYSRTLFREPLVALLWTVSALCGVLWLSGRRVRWAILAMLGLLAASAVKLTAVMALPVFLGVATTTLPRRQWTRLWKPAMSVALLGAVVLMAAYRWRYGAMPSVARYTINYPFGDFLLRSYGQIASPAKGLLAYSPILLAAAAGWPALWRRSRPMALLIIGLLLCTLYLYGTHGMWYGGLVWGPRFMLPLLPLLMLPLAATLTRTGVRGRALIGLCAVVLCAALSLLVQLPVSTSVWSVHVQEIDPLLNPTLPWWDPRLWPLTPPLRQFTHWKPWWVNLVWWHYLSDGTLVRDIRLGAGLGALLAAAIALLADALWRGDREGRHGGWAAIALSLALTVTGSGALLWRGYHTPYDFIGLSPAEARDVAVAVAADGSPYTLVTVSNDFGINFRLGFMQGRFAHYWVSPTQTDGFDSLIQGPFAQAPLWLAVDHAHMQSDHHPQALEHWLNRHAYRAGSRWVGGIELFRYMPPVEALPTQAVHCVWDDRLALVAWGQDAYELRPGQGLRLQFEFEALDDVPHDYVWFAHLVAGDGGQIPGQDGPPQYGAAPTSTWQRGQRVTDRRAILVPPEAPPGSYTLMVGFIGPNGQRGMARCTDYVDGETHADYVALGGVTVLP